MGLPGGISVTDRPTATTGWTVCNSKYFLATAISETFLSTTFLACVLLDQSSRCLKSSTVDGGLCNNYRLLLGNGDKNEVGNCL